MPCVWIQHSDADAHFLRRTRDRRGERKSTAIKIIFGYPGRAETHFLRAPDVFNLSKRVDRLETDAEVFDPGHRLPPARVTVAERHPRFVLGRGGRAVEVPHLPDTIRSTVVALVNFSRANAIRRRRYARNFNARGKRDTHDILAGEPSHI